MAYSMDFRCDWLEEMRCPLFSHLCSALLVCLVGIAVFLSGQAAQSVNKCTLPRDEGRLCEFDSPSTRFYYDVSLGTCTEFRYLGCGENRNNFHTRKWCEWHCVKESNSIDDESGAQPTAQAADSTPLSRAPSSDSDNGEEESSGGGSRAQPTAQTSPSTRVTGVDPSSAEEDLAQPTTPATSKPDSSSAGGRAQPNEEPSATPSHSHSTGNAQSTSGEDPTSSATGSVAVSPASNDMGLPGVLRDTILAVFDSFNETTLGHYFNTSAFAFAAKGADCRRCSRHAVVVKMVRGKCAVSQRYYR